MTTAHFLKNSTFLSHVTVTLTKPISTLVTFWPTPSPSLRTSYVDIPFRKKESIASPFHPFYSTNRSTNRALQFDV